MATQQFDNRGQVSLWKKDSDNEKAPVLSGSVVAHRDIAEGEALDIALWKNESENENAPALKGKISNKYQKEDAGQGGFRKEAPKAANPFLDSDIPF